ncbi:hypothetical protein ACFY2R_22605 [Micromonospora olivasterospora]|uniref:Uncharacterized protein n=1 Tax=Micromonospora olivasterospora TaxID=1880 RepID=A0A562IDF3_MICOL|nr:hypothetical protein [Micromonospora olivasterospora]TWH68876.1 hypothetical protein JD77_03877 [Micromonospora olivasterospora]
MTRRTVAPLVSVGDVVTVAEDDYCYGTGPLRLRITRRPAGLDHPRLEWVELTGVELRPDGSAACGDQARTAPVRSALVRVAALRGRASGAAR